MNKYRISEIYDELASLLADKYGAREANNILKIYFADRHDVSNPRHSTKEIDKTLFDADFNKFRDDIPVQYIVGKAPFYDLMFKVNQHTLIPRPETEELVHWILEDYRGIHTLGNVLDVGTGSGCIAITLKKKHRPFRMFATDISLDAINTAAINSRMHDTHVEFIRADFRDAQERSILPKVDMLVSNPPYIPMSEKRDLSDHVIKHEPSQALFVTDSDPLEFYRYIYEFAKENLHSNGSVYLECHEKYTSLVSQLFNEYEVVIRKDLQGKPRMIKATKK